MTEPHADRSPRTKARIAGVFYLLTIVTGALALFVADPLRPAMLLASTLCYVVVTILLYGLFRPVDRNLSALAAVVSLAGCGLQIVRFLAPGWTSLNPLVFFGGYCLLIGYLILRSTFLPRVLGVLMGLGGLGWLTFASPALSGFLAPYNMAPGILGESAFTIWLLAAGVNTERWNEQARAGAKPAQ